MKKLFFILLCLSVALTADAGPFMKNQSRGLPASGGAPSSLTFFWRCESATLDGTDDYSAGDTTASDANVTYTTDAVKMGTNGMDADGANHYSTFTSTSIINDAGGTISFWFYVNTWVDEAKLFQVWEGGSDYIFGRLDGTDEFQVYNYNASGPTNQQLTTTTANLVTGVWYFLEYSWDTSGNSHTLTISQTTRGDKADQTEDETLVAISSGTLYIGNATANAADMYIDGIMIFNEAGVNAYQYKDTAAYTDF
jgi:hypothetical protein